MIDLHIEQNEIHTAIWNWLFEGSNGISELSFMAASYDSDDAIKSDSRVIYTPETIGTSEVIKSYLDGTQYLRYNFMLQQYAPISTQSNTPANIVTLSVFEGLKTWIKEQVLTNALPKFPEGAGIVKIVVNPGSVAGVDAGGAKFQMLIQIEYTDNKRKRGL